MRSVVNSAVELICETMQTKTVCTSLISSYLDIILGSIIDRTSDPLDICQTIMLCPKTSHTASLDDYIAEVLKDKPPQQTVSPSKKTYYNILHLADPHIDLEYQVVSLRLFNELLIHFIGFKCFL